MQTRSVLYLLLGCQHNNTTHSLFSLLLAGKCGLLHFVFIFHILQVPIGTPLSKHNIILEIINNYIYQHCLKCLRYCLGFTGVV